MLIPYDTAKFSTLTHRDRVKCLVLDDAVMKKPEAADALIHTALEAGIQASCVLMDTWLINEPFIHTVLGGSLDVIRMAKDNKQRYGYKGKLLSLKELVQHTQIDSASSILGSITVSTKKYHIPVKLVFVRVQLSSNRVQNMEYSRSLPP